MEQTPRESCAGSRSEPGSMILVSLQARRHRLPKHLWVVNVDGGCTMPMHNLVHGQAGTSPARAVRLTKAFGRTPEMWLRLQMAYDLA